MDVVENILIRIAPDEAGAWPRREATVYRRPEGK